MASSLRRNPFIGCAAIELQFQSGESLINAHRFFQKFGSKKFA